MHSKSLQDYALHRIGRAADDLDTARIDFEAGKYNAAVNRAYYAVYHTIRAVLSLDEKEFKKHSGTIGYFTKEYLATNIVNREFSAVIKKAFAARNAGDYDDFYDATRDDAESLISDAKRFHQAIAEYVHQRIAEIEK